MDPIQMEKMHQIVENTIGPESRQQITQLLGQINALNGAEKLLLYLKLPAGPAPADPLKQPVNPLGSRAEIHQTVMWIQTHLEVDPEISLPKQDVYNEYLQYCNSTKMKPLSTADFGKVMKQVYPCVKPRRLGTRGNSRYCYAGMRKRIKLEVPLLPDLYEKQKTVEIPAVQNDLLIAASQLIREWAEKILGSKFINLCELARHLVEKDLVENSSNSASFVMNTITESNEESDTADDKNVDFHQKSNSRGVIKQLKRKIQLQPQNSAAKVSNMKKLKSQDSREMNLENSEDTLEPLPSETDEKIPVKKETDLCKAEEHSSLSSPQLENKIKGVIPHSSNEAVLHFPPSEYPPNAVVNLSQTNTARSRNYREVVNPFKGNPQNMHKPVFEFEHFQNIDISTQPTNLSLNSFVNYNLDKPPSYPLTPNLPINLSNNNSEESYMTKYYKSPMRNLELHSAASQNDSLNLSISQHREDTQASTISSPNRLPLPGKKMILEAYNNENQINNPSYYGHQAIKLPLVSPVKITDTLNHGEYLPKKMRAAESLSGKLAASRLISNVNTNSPSKEPDKCKLMMPKEYFPPSLPKLELNRKHNMFFQQMDYVEVPETSPDRLMRNPLAKPPRNYKMNKKATKAKIDCINNNVQGIEKTATRGRPRKKSLSKAKYTRRQPKNTVTNICNHSKHPKRSSDSCCSLTESINIKTEIICAEKHSEILNRERVSSICNMDKDALDDYLNESSSQENEEELMKYFHSNAEPLANIDNTKVISPNKIDIKDEPINRNVTNATENQDTRAPTASELLCSNISDTSTQGSDFLEANNDHRDEHNQKNDKIYALRRLLEKNLAQSSNSAVVSTLYNDQSIDVSMKHTNTSIPNPTLSHPNASESAFKLISTRNTAIPNNSNNEVQSTPHVDVLPKLLNENINKPSSVDSFKPRFSARRSVSFETPISRNSDDLTHIDKGSSNYIRGQSSPSSRVQRFNFMPISPGRLSPVNSSKISPTASIKKSIVGKSAGVSTICTSPANLNSPSPFVSPRNTPVPRSRAGCQVKPIPNKFQMKKLSKLDINNKPLFLNDGLPIKDKSDGELLRGMLYEPEHFAMPSEQSTISCSPNYLSKNRNFPMSAPPSPNILAPKYKPHFNLANHLSASSTSAQSVIQIHPSPKSLFRHHGTLSIPIPDSTNDHIQPLSADPLSHEVSGFFSDNSDHIDNINNSLRSQSVPLNQNNPQNDGLLFYNRESVANPISSNVAFVSYNNTPCNSIPATPVPREFCDFGNLNDTCESITKACLNSENLDKIYNVLDSTVSSELVRNELVKSENILMNMHVTDSNLSHNDYVSSSTNIIEPSLTEDVEIDSMSKHMQFTNHLYTEQSNDGSNEYLKRSNSVDIDIGNPSMENRFFISRSVPSTPLPYGKGVMPNFDLGKPHGISQTQYDDYNPNLSRKLLASKSVPSTPLTTDDRNIFSYSNRDFLINGNSVDHSISNSFADKDIQNKDHLQQNFLNESNGHMEGKSGSSVLAELPESMDIDCIASELPTFNEQGIMSENDLLRDLEII